MLSEHCGDIRTDLMVSLDRKHKKGQKVYYEHIPSLENFANAAQSKIRQKSHDRLMKK